MAEIINVENEVIVAAVEETSGAATGTKVISNHSVTGANQHTIGAITGLEDRLQTIEELKDTLRVKGMGHADYYQWGEEATEDNPLGPGYFVRLGEDGMIYKCEGEEVEVQTTLPLETKQVVTDDSETWSEADKITTYIYYVVATKIYYNYEVNAWVGYTEEEYKQIALDKILMKYAYAGEIQTKDISKYYVVGTYNNETKQWIEPFDIYAYNGIEYVKKPAYSYKDGKVYKNALMDVFGVTISSAGFVGNDENIDETHTSAKAKNINYALVATTGVVDVICDHEVVVGDYVYPYACGRAKKSTGSYGYLVTAIMSDANDILYARIILTPSVVLAKEVSNNVDSLLETTRRLDANIVTFGNTAEAALKRAEELTEAAQQSANTSSQNAQDATNAAVNAQQSAADAWGAAEQAAPIAQQAAEDAKAAQEAVLTLKDEAIASANETAAQIATDKSNETLNTVRTLEYRLDEYTVGQYSQAYGLTYAQAQAILPLGTTFIPMDEDCTVGLTYEEVYANEEADVKQVFTVGYAYVWTANGWLVDKTVLITRTPTEQTTGDYWFVTEDYDGTEYKRGALYRWESGKWVEKAVRVENTMSRTIAHLYHEDDAIRQSVSSVDGKVAAVETRVTETDARVGLVASVPTELEGIKPGNYNEETEGLDIIVDKATLDTDWADKAVNGKYYVVGNKLPYDIYEWDESEFVLKDTITYDGVNFYKANVANIFTTANEDGSNISLNADKIQFTSKAFNIFASDGDGNITKDAEGNPVVNFAVDNAGNVGVRGKITATEGKIGNLTVGADGSLTCEKVQTNEEGVETTITTFQLDAEGNASFEGNGVFSGTVVATSGSIGGCEIVDGNLTIQSANIASLDASKVMVTGTESITTVIENTLIDSKVYYALSDSVTTEPIQNQEKPETVWNTTAPAYQEGMYMWQQTVNTYNCAPAAGEEADEDGHKVVRITTCIAGASGKGIKDVISYYLATDVAEDVTTETEGWTTSIQYTSQDKKFLWKYEKIEYTEGDPKLTTPCIVGMFGESVAYRYYLSNSNTPPEYKDTNGDNVINTDDGWYDAPQGISKDNPYEYVVQVMGTSTTSPTLWAKYGFDGGVLQETIQYLVSDSMTSTPDVTDTRWKDDFPTYNQDGGDHIWTGQNYVWQKTVITHDGADEEVEIIVLPTMEVATILAEKDNQQLSEWCKDKDITLIDGASIATGSIAADRLNVAKLSAINANVGELEAGVLRSSNYIKGLEAFTRGSVEYTLNDDGTTYAVTRVNIDTDTLVCIPSTYNDASVTVIGNEAFVNCESMTDIIIPSTITAIGENAFYGCSGLNGVYYVGTKEQWKQITIASGNELLTEASHYYISHYEQTEQTGTYSLPINVSEVSGTWTSSGDYTTISVSNEASPDEFDISNLLTEGVLEDVTLTSDYQVIKTTNYTREFNDFNLGTLTLSPPQEDLQDGNTYEYTGANQIVISLIDGAKVTLNLYDATTSSWKNINLTTVNQTIHTETYTHENGETGTLTLKARITTAGRITINASYAVKLPYTASDPTHYFSPTTIIRGSYTAYRETVYARVENNIIFAYQSLNGKVPTNYDTSSGDLGDYTVSKCLLEYKYNDTRNYINVNKQGCGIVIDNGTIETPYFQLSSEGKIEATGGVIGGFSIGDTTLSNSYTGVSLSEKGLSIDSSDGVIRVGQTTLRIGSDSAGVILDAGDEPFSITSQGASIGFLQNVVEASSVLFDLKVQFGYVYRDGSGFTTDYYADGRAYCIFKVTLTKTTEQEVDDITFSVPYRREWIDTGGVLEDGILSFSFSKTDIEDVCYTRPFELAISNSQQLVITKYNSTESHNYPCDENTDEISSTWKEYYEKKQYASIVDIGIKGHLIPYSSATYTLGEDTMRWKEAWINAANINTQYTDSDKNKKHNISTLTNQHSEFFDKLKPVTFTYNDDIENKIRTGLIAQDTKGALDEVGLDNYAIYHEWQESNGNNTCSLVYQDLIALCINEIQKLKKRVAELENNTK